MQRVPFPLVLLLSLTVVAVVWWRGTKDYDFQTPPSPAQIEIARMRAAGELIQPSDLFEIDPVEEIEAVEIKPPTPPPALPPPIPVIEIGDLSLPPSLDAWHGHAGMPAASFINLASELETGTQLSWALLGWERVLDSSSPSEEEREAALKGVRRLRATLPPWNGDPEASIPLTLLVDAPADRLKISMRAAAKAADILDKASSGIIKTSAVVKQGQGTAASPKVKIVLTGKGAEDSPSVVTPAPEGAEEIEKVILGAVFKLIRSKLALREDLEPLSAPEPGEPPSESLEYRVTRLTWRKFAESTINP